MPHLEISSPDIILMLTHTRARLTQPGITNQNVYTALMKQVRVSTDNQEGVVSSQSQPEIPALLLIAHLKFGCRCTKTIQHMAKTKSMFHLPSFKTAHAQMEMSYLYDNECSKTSIQHGHNITKPCSWVVTFYVLYIHEYFNCLWF